MVTPTSRRSTRLAVLFAALLLVLVACSGSDDPEAESVATEPVVEATTEEITTEATPTELTTDAATDMATDMPTDMATDMATDAADAGTDTTAGSTDIVTALQDAGLTSLATAVQAAGLEEQLQALPEFTVFAPDEEAFQALGADLPTDPAEIQSLLTYHVVDQRILSTDLTDGDNTVTTLEGSDLTVTSANGEVTVGDGGATVTQPDMEVGDNGVVHVIDAVLEPSS